MPFLDISPRQLVRRERCRESESQAFSKPWTETLWIYDLRTNQHFTLKENPLKRSDLDDFVARYNVKNRHERRETERFKPFTYAELTKRDKINLDIFWLKDESLEDSANLPDLRQKASCFTWSDCDVTVT